MTNFFPDTEKSGRSKWRLRREAYTLLPPKVGLGICKRDKNKNNGEGPIKNLGLGRFLNIPNF